MVTKVVGIGFIVIGAAFLGMGIYITYQNMDFLSRGLQTTAVVVDFNLEEEHDPDTGWDTVYIPVFQFINQRTGEQVNATGSTGSPSPAYFIGEEVDILYKPDDPTARVIVKSFWDLWIPPLLCMPAGSGAIIVGIYILKQIVW